MAISNERVGAETPRHAAAREVLEFLRDDTDTFDPVILKIMLDHGDSPKMTDEQIGLLADAFAGTDESSVIEAVDALMQIDRRFAIPVYARVYTGRPNDVKTKSLRSLTPDERQAITGIEVRVNA